MPKFISELNDPRYFQILYLGSFLFYGISYLGWDIQTGIFSVIFITAILTQLSFARVTNKNYHSVKSALITALGLCLLMRTTFLWVAVLATFIAIASKFTIRVKNKHIFNPANIGIVAVLALTDYAWVSPGQWGSSLIMWFFIGSAGLMMILKVGRLETAFSFLAIYGGLLFLYSSAYLGWDNQVWLHKMSNGTLLLFAFFMITDPKTTPDSSKARLLFGTLLGLLLFILSQFLFVQTAAMWLLFFISPFTPLFDKKFKAPRFEWKQQVKIKTQ